MINKKGLTFTLQLFLPLIGRAGFGFDRPMTNCYLNNPSNNINSPTSKQSLHKVVDRTTTKMTGRGGLLKPRKQLKIKPEEIKNIEISKSVSGKTSEDRRKIRDNIKDSSKSRRSSGLERLSRRQLKIIGGDNGS